MEKCSWSIVQLIPVSRNRAAWTFNFNFAYSEIAGDIGNFTERYEELLEAPHVRPMDFTGKPLKGFLYIEPRGFATETGLSQWLTVAVELAGSLPAK